MGYIITLRYILRHQNKKFEALSAQTDFDDLDSMAHLNVDERNAVLNNFRYVT